MDRFYTCEHIYTFFEWKDSTEELWKVFPSTMTPIVCGISVKSAFFFLYPFLDFFSFLWSGHKSRRFGGKRGIIRLSVFVFFFLLVGRLASGGCRHLFFSTERIRSSVRIKRLLRPASILVAGWGSLFDLFDRFPIIFDSMHKKKCQVFLSRLAIKVIDFWMTRNLILELQ